MDKRVVPAAVYGGIVHSWMIEGDRSRFYLTYSDAMDELTRRG